MRPDRFTNQLIEAIGRDGQLSAHSYPQSAATTQWGFVVRGTKVKASVQVCARSALGDDYGEPEHIVTGVPHRGLTSPAKVDSLISVERYLAALIVDEAAEEIMSVRLYAMRDKPGAMRHGATIQFHDGSAIFMYVTNG